MGEYEGFYERLSNYEELEGKAVQEWLKEWKKGDSPTVTKKEEQELKNIHEERRAQEESSRFKEEVDSRDVEYDEGFESGRTVIKHSQGEADIDEVSGVYRHPNGTVYVQGRNGQVLGAIE